MIPTRPPSPVPRPSSSPLVTIAIPTYNRADSYLPQALKSALNQTYPNLEIIVSDNCSTDGTMAFVSGITDPRLRYFRHNVNIGAHNNFKFCIDQAKGSYVLLLHDDDLIDNDLIESCIRAAGGMPDIGIIRTGVRLIDPQGNVRVERPNFAAGIPAHTFFQQWFSGKTAIYLCNTLFNTQRLREIGGIKSKHNCYDDTMAIVRLAVKYPRVDVAAVKASFRIHGGQMGSATKIGEWCEDSFDLLSLIGELASENKDQVLHEGLRFFSRANYGRARMAKSPFERLIASIKVLKYFKFRHLPSVRHLLAIFHGTRLHEVLRHVKRSWQRVFSRA
jgi:glycosyltransferase involved in cell wall biosynthesis